MITHLDTVFSHVPVTSLLAFRSSPVSCPALLLMGCTRQSAFPRLPCQGSQGRDAHSSVQARACRREFGKLGASSWGLGICLHVGAEVPCYAGSPRQGVSVVGAQDPSVGNLLGETGTSVESSSAYTIRVPATQGSDLRPLLSQASF